MKILIILLIFIFCLIIGKLNKKDFKFSFLIAIAFIFTPVILLHPIDKIILIYFCSSLILFLLYEFLKNKIIKNILFVLIIIFYSLGILMLTNILNINFNIDTQKLFFVDNNSLETIHRFQQNALYLPVFLRPLVYSFLQFILITISKIISFLWIDKIITFFGFSILYLAFFAFKNKKNTKYFIFPILIILFSVLHRDPNTYLTYLLSIPALILIFTKNIKNINSILLISIIFISYLYSII